MENKETGQIRGEGELEAGQDSGEQTLANAFRRTTTKTWVVSMSVSCKRPKQQPKPGWFPCKPGLFISSLTLSPPQQQWALQLQQGPSSERGHRLAHSLDVALQGPHETVGTNSGWTFARFYKSTKSTHSRSPSMQAGCVSKPGTTQQSVSFWFPFKPPKQPYAKNEPYTHTHIDSTFVFQSPQAQMSLVLLISR